MLPPFGLASPASKNQIRQHFAKIRFASADKRDFLQLGADFVPLDHYTSILALPAHRESIMKFFEENFTRLATDEHR